MKFGIVVLPGSNCDHDAEHVASAVAGHEVEMLWHRRDDVSDVDCVVIPGGFSYGDYLRAGALAKFAPVMKAVNRHAAAGGLVIGICNGFQILTETGLLPGTLMRNEHLRFVCKDVRVRTESDATPFTSQISPGTILNLVVAHGEGNYYADEATLDMLEANDRVIFRYCDEEGRITASANPNGSARNIAGICNEGRNVMGLMPHPERRSEQILGSADGFRVFESIIASFTPAVV